MLSSRHGRGGSDSGSFVAGQLLADRFQILRWIGSGGMGDVYEARDLELEEQVAVKTIRQEIASDAKAMNRFRREISLARKVTHPGVCRIFDVFFHAVDDTPEADPRTAFLTMELLEGITLSAHLRQAGPMSTGDAEPLVRQIASALASAHAAGVVHRDFKSGNVMLVGNPGGVRAVITDFGLARRSGIDDGVGAVTRADEIVGSPAYMAPEQVTGGQITPATDVYSLGVVMYQMVTGRLPFKGSSSLATLVLRTQEDPPPPSLHAQDLDGRWETLILKCLARDPEDRFADAAGLLAELEPATAPERPGARRSRRRWVEATLALLLVAVGAAYLLSSWRSPEPTTPPATAPPPNATGSRHSVAVLGFKNLSGRPETAWMSSALAELLATELAIVEGVRTVPGEHVARMRIELAVRETDGLAADTLARIGQHLNADHVVVGSYLAENADPGSPLRLDARIKETATGETLVALSETASETGLLDLVSRLGSELRRELGLNELTIDQQASKRASQPANSAAARLYVQGLAALRNFDALTARGLLRQAADADPGYVLAYAALAESWSTLGYDDEAMEQITVAFELSAMLPRQERLLIEGQFREQTQEWERAIEIYRELVEAFPDHLEYGLDLARVQVKGNRPQAAEATVTRLRQLSPPAGDDPRIDLGEAELAWSLAQYPRILEASMRAVEKGQRLGARWLVAEAWHHEGLALWRMGRLGEAVEMVAQAERAFRELGDLSASARALNVAGVIHYELEELDAAMASYDQALAIFREIGHRVGIDNVLNNQAMVLQLQGDLDGAAELYQQTLAIARDTDDKTNISIGLYNLALVRQAQGQSATAKRMYEEALVLAREIENPYLVATRLTGLANLIAAAGDLATSRGHYTEALAIMRQLDDHYGAIFTLHHLGQLDLAGDDLAAARRCFEEALALGTELGTEGRVLNQRVALARLALEEDKVREAMDEAREAADAFAASERFNGELSARLVLAEAALKSGRLPDARAATDRALELRDGSEEVELDVAVLILEARVLAAEGDPDRALARLKAALVKATAARRFGQQLEARLATATIEIQAGRGDAGRARLAAVEKDAAAQGFALVARKARELSGGLG